MNLARRTSLSLLFVTLGTLPAHAAFTGEGGRSIEASAGGEALQSIDKLLGGGNHPELFDSVLKQHDKSAQPSKTIMDGHFDREGSINQPSLFGQQDSQRPAPQLTPGEAPDLAKTAIVRLGGINASSDSASLTAMSSRSLSPTSVAGSNGNPSIQSLDPTTGPATFITGDLEATPVPLPAAGLLLASGLVAFPVLRRKRLPKY